MRVRPLAALLLVLAPACVEGTPDFSPSVRGDRYCEILLGTIDMDAGLVQLDVYNTYGLNDCPEDAWAAVDEAAVQTETMADVVRLNGPRYWVLDAFEKSELLDPTPRVLGGLEMRKAGTLELTLADVADAGAAYVARSVRRDTTWRYAAGGSVYELVDPDGRVFVMQSYSVQVEAQTEASLAELSARLAPPAGWMFRHRELEADLRVVAEDGVATVVQDELANTYQLSQQ